MMNYSQFKEEIAAMITAEEGLGLTRDLITVHYRGEHVTDERSKEWILKTNLKYFQRESDTLLGDFLEIMSPEDETLSARFEMKAIFHEYEKNGWQRIVDIIKDNMKLCHANAGQMNHIEDFAEIKDRLIVRPLNYPALRKSGEAKDIVCRVYGDIALVLYFFLCETDGDYMTGKVAKNVMELWKVPEEEIW